MTHPLLLRLSLLPLVLILPGLAAAAPPAAPPASAPAAASADSQQAEAEKQEKANAEKQKKAAAEKQKKVDIEKQKQTVADIRRLGTALFSWLTDQVEATVAEQEAEKQAEKQTENRGEAPPRGNVEDTQQKTFDIQDNPLISRDDLEDLLVPDYLAAIPETDAWGNPYEIRINTDNLMAKTVISIRSPGRKGYYAGDVYKIESFDPADVDQDIVWADGYFVRWPQAGTPANKPLPIPPSGQR